MKNDIIDELGNLDDEQLAEAVKICPPLDKSEKRHIAELCEKKLARYDNDDDGLHIVSEVSGDAEVITKTPWYRSAIFRAAAGFTIAAGLGISAFIGIARNYGSPPAADFSEVIIESEEATEPPTEYGTVLAQLPKEEHIINLEIEFPKEATGKYDITIFRYDPEAYPEKGTDAFEVLTLSDVDVGGRSSIVLGIDSEESGEMHVIICNKSKDISACIGIYYFDFDKLEYTVLTEDVEGALKTVGALPKDDGEADRMGGHMTFNIPEDAVGTFEMSLNIEKSDGTVEKRAMSTIYCPDSLSIDYDLDVDDCKHMIIYLTNLANNKTATVDTLDGFTGYKTWYVSDMREAFEQVDGIKIDN